MEDLEKLATQLDELIVVAEKVIDDDWGQGNPRANRQARISCNRLEAAIDRIAPPDTLYTDRLAEFRSELLEEKFDEVYSLAVALRDDLKAGWVESVVELVHADTYDNYLSMAAGLLQSGYKDAAAVITATSLEVHVRSLCIRSGVAIKLPNGTPKKADVMNAELRKEGVYNDLQQKSVTAWLGLRNKAAHGEWDAYDDRDVRALIQGVRDFILKYPA
ncbi:hypothetical protein ACFY5F_48505 [Streptomyces sp. NPDC013161]|uniref:hypothetical protein n=1 Tax=Streptomyces sp. NPDC013161 TaxID=3364862 RepID=UPI00367D161D